MYLLFSQNSHELPYLKRKALINFVFIFMLYKYNNIYFFKKNLKFSYWFKTYSPLVVIISCVCLNKSYTNTAYCFALRHFFIHFVCIVCCIVTTASENLYRCSPKTRTFSLVTCRTQSSIIQPLHMHIAYVRARCCWMYILNLLYLHSLQCASSSNPCSSFCLGRGGGSILRR